MLKWCLLVSIFSWATVFAEEARDVYYQGLLTPLNIEPTLRQGLSGGLGAGAVEYGNAVALRAVWHSNIARRTLRCHPGQPPRSRC
jgi:hypothetical protein